MLRFVGTIFAALFGLAFGSFLNVCLSRWPEGESIVHPHSHCRNCNRTLVWWENIPIVSWLVLRGRCRTCGTTISWRYPLVEASVAILWVFQFNRFFELMNIPNSPGLDIALADLFGKLIFFWMLVALAFLDTENLWLPDRVTLPGIVLGFFVTLWLSPRQDTWSLEQATLMRAALNDLLAIFFAAGLILIIRGIYWRIRGKEGIGLGDAKLMAMLAAWLGLPGALLSFFLAVTLGAAVAIPLLLSKRTAGAKLPLGTFLSIGGIVATLWGKPILNTYLHWVGF